MIAPLILACGTLLLVVSLGLGQRGAALRRFALMLIALPFVGAVLFGALPSIGGRFGDAISLVIGIFVVTIIAYAIVDLRSRLKAAKQDSRIREKRPLDREPNLLALLRDELRGEDGREKDGEP